MTALEKWSVWVTSLLTGLTGVGYFWAKYLNEPATEWAVVSHPLEPWFLKAHILVSPLLLLALGMVLLRHVWRHYRSGIRWGRKSGILTFVAVAPMVATGYLIQVLTSAGWVRAMAISHIVFGVLYLVGIGLHQVATSTPPGSVGRKREAGERRSEPPERSSLPPRQRSRVRERG